MDVEQLLHMNDGEEKISYASNSSHQRWVIMKTQPLIQEAIQHLLSTNNTVTSTFNIADLGCSYGPNSLLPISIVLDAAHEAQKQSGWLTCPEFCAFLNDLPGNNFNSVFRTFPAFYNTINQEKGENFGPCFVLAAPGSFHGRIFPTDSLHFVYSCYSVHWLSQVPPIGNLNKGNIGLGKTSPEVVFKAYLNQFQKDFTNFLKVRSKEIVSGGRMVLAFMSRRMANPFAKECFELFYAIGDGLQELIDEGFLEESKVATFNMPFYEPHIEELRDVIKAEGSFDIIRLDAQIRPANIDSTKSPHIVDVGFISNFTRAAIEPLLLSHFEVGIIDKLFKKYSQKLEEKGSLENVFIQVSLARKVKGLKTSSNSA